MKVLDLFSGVGGFRFGMEAAGHQTVGWVERDKFARQAYKAIHQPTGEWTHDDIRTVDYMGLTRADIWTFGFPCQDISIAGKQTGFGGERSSLFFATTKLLRQIKESHPDELPTYLVIENVKNFLSVNGGWDFLSAQIELDEIGYDCEWQLLNSSNYGVPQNRERVFIIGHLRGRSGGKVFPIRGKGSSTTLQQINGPAADAFRIYDSKGLARTLKAEAGGGGAKTGLYLVPTQLSAGEGLAYCLDANYSKGISSLKKAKRTHIAVITPDRENKRQNGRRMKEAGEPMFTLTAQDKHGVYDGYRIRKLTPLECWRLQAFPDWAFKRAKEAGLSDSQLYRQAGNSVTTTIIYEIARRLGNE